MHVPSTLPRPQLAPDCQPIFGQDPRASTVAGYVDTASALCEEVRANVARYGEAEVAQIQSNAQDYHPRQCGFPAANLYHDPAVIMEFVRRFHLAGLPCTSTRSAIGGAQDRAGRSGGGPCGRRMSDQLDDVRARSTREPADVVRIGRDHCRCLYLCMGRTDPEYDITVMPFVDKVSEIASRRCTPRQLLRCQCLSVQRA